MYVYFIKDARLGKREMEVAEELNEVCVRAKKNQKLSRLNREPSAIKVQLRR